MTTTLTRNFQETLQKIGDINPFWDEKSHSWRFQSPYVPEVDVRWDTPENTAELYKLTLKEHLEKVPDIQQTPRKPKQSARKKTSSWGGAREGAGRPAKAPRKRITVPLDIADWIQEVGEENVRKVING